MSGIYIPGMEMPDRCLACQLSYESCSCILTGEGFYKHGEDFDPAEKRLDSCPLIHLHADSCGEHGEPGTPTTNYGHIISMEPEQFAAWLREKISCIDCPQEENCLLYGRSLECKKVWLEWLQSPVEEGKG